MISLHVVLLTAPSMAPLDVTASNRSSTAIYVGWSPIPQQFIHGILMGYHLHYINTDPEGFGDVSKGIHTIETGRTSALIQGLLKFTNYRIQVSGFTVKGNGPRSDVVVVKTEEDGKNKSGCMKNYSWSCSRDVSEGFFIISKFSCSRSLYGLLSALRSERIYVAEFINIYLWLPPRKLVKYENNSSKQENKV